MTLEGRILSSDGFQLRVHLLCRDSLGRIWLDQVYQDQANAADYPDKIATAEDPFLDLYIRMANDLALSLQNQSREMQSSLVDAALLRYAQALSPETFSRYINYDQQGQMLLLGLPARDDPMYKRVLRIRESEPLREHLEKKTLWSAIIFQKWFKLKPCDF